MYNCIDVLEFLDVASHASRSSLALTSEFSISPLAQFVLFYGCLCSRFIPGGTSQKKVSAPQLSGEIQGSRLAGCVPLPLVALLLRV
jgi:hypothetical protein